MMKYLIMLSLCFMIAACDSDSRYVDEKTLWDKTGCAFIARQHIGDTVMLYFNQDLSRETCQYSKGSK